MAAKPSTGNTGATRKHGASGKDWEEAFLQMEERYLRAQQEINRRNDEDKLRKVQSAKSAKSDPAESSFSAQRRRPASSNPSTLNSPLKRPPSAASLNKENAARAKTPAAREHDGAATAGPAGAAGAAEFVQRAPPLGQTLYSTLANAGAPPDPTMVWGVDETLLGMVKSNVLIQVNEKLRGKLGECEDVLKMLQNDVARGRRTNESLAGQVHTLTVERDHLMMERETTVSKASSCEAALLAIQAQMRELASQHDINRATMEEQCRQLRGKLSLAYDQNDTLTTENRRVSAELRDAQSLSKRLETHLMNVTSTGSTQKEVNQNLILELKTLNDQLATERRRVLDLTRELQLQTENKRHVEELKSLLDSVRQEKHLVEQENMKLLGEASVNHELAANAARESLKDEMTELRAVAAHWENFSRLQFRDVQLRTQKHLELKEAHEQVRMARDAAEVQLIHLRSDVEALSAKLDVVWPSHDRDTGGLTAKDIRAAFVPKFSRRNVNDSTDGFPIAADVNGGASPVMSLLSAKLIEKELGEGVSPDIVIGELRQANDLLVAESEALKATIKVLSAQLSDTVTSAAEQRRELADTATTMHGREVTRLQTLERYTDRIDFLEAQVRTLRGTAIDDRSFSVAALNCDTETVLVLELGQLLMDCGVTSTAGIAIPMNVPHSVESEAIARKFWSDFPVVFVTADFLLHETVATDVVATSTAAFLDKVVSYRVQQDALLLHNLSCRPLIVELHRVAGVEKYETVARGTVSLNSIVMGDVVRASRPSITVHADMYLLDSKGDATSTILARLEVKLTSRCPFALPFVKLCEAHVTALSREQGPNMSTESMIPPHQRSFGLFGTSMQDTAAVSSIRPADQSQYAIALAAAQSSYRQLPIISNVIRLLEKVTRLTIRVDEVRINFSMPRSPLLSFWYALPAASESGEIADIWVLPPEPVARYEYSFNFVAHHRITSAEVALAMVRHPIPLVAFDAEEEDPTVSWAVASLDLSSLLDRPGVPVSANVPLIASTDGARVGLVKIEAEFGFSS
jgi:hypothetical protein